MVLLGGLLAARPADPEAAEPTLEASRAAGLRASAAEAERALDALIRELQRAVDAARRGSALVIEGDLPPGPELEAAALAAGEATDEAAFAANVAARLDGTLAAVAPALGPLPEGPFGASLPGIASQLRAAAEAGGSFVERRRASETTLRALADALAALQAGEPRAALRALDAADAARAVVAGWDEPPVVLPYWIDTTGAMLAAARRIAQATIDEDADEAKRAGRAYRRAATEARRADTALALAISESGAALAANPLRRLAEAMARATEQRQAVASVLQAAR